MTRLVRVVPAILTADPKALEAMVRRAEGFTTYVQFDIMDGQFVPSRSIGAEHLTHLPMKLRWEAHLMVQEPGGYLAHFQQVGAQRVIFHYEAASSPEEVISLARNLGLEVGLALNPETPAFAIRPLVSKVDSVLLLTVDPGFYGSQFIPEALEKVAELRSIRPEIEVGVDGGIKEDNIARVARTGVDTICVGSAIFLQPQPDESFHRLLNLARQGSG